MLDFSGSWGRVGLDLEEISKNIQPLGKNLVGSVFQNGYTSTSTTETWWETLHLSENDYIQAFGVADAGADNSGSYDKRTLLCLTAMRVSFKSSKMMLNFFQLKSLIVEKSQVMTMRKSIKLIIQKHLILIA